MEDSTWFLYLGFLGFYGEEIWVIFKSTVATVSGTRTKPPCQLMPRGTSCAIVLHAFCIAIFIRLNRLSRNTSKHLSLVQLMNMFSNLIFHCNHCDAITAFITVHESTAATPSRPSGLLNAKFTFKGGPPPIIFARIVRPINGLQFCR